MDTTDIADRRHLRRKITFWRAAAFLAVALLLLALIGYFGGFASGPEGRGDQIARVTISGVITDDRDLAKRLEHIAETPSVKALIVVVNSPGGTTFGGEATFKAIRKVAAVKPVATEIRTLAASAGYMIASAGDYIVAGDASIVGSIGVIFQYAQVSDLLQKIGVSIDEIKSAPLKAEPSPFHPASEDAKAMIRSMILDSFDWFVDLVSERRRFSREKTLSLADGSIFTGRQALANGLVDAIGGEEEIRTWLEGKGVPARIGIVDWDEEGDGRRFFFARAAVDLFRQMSGASLPFHQELQALADRKLFLDGLVSVWQVGGRSLEQK